MNEIHLPPMEICAALGMSALALVISIMALVRSKIRDTKPPLDFRTVVATLFLTVAGILFLTSLACFYMVLLGYIKHCGDARDFWIPVVTFGFGVVNVVGAFLSRYA